MTKKEAVNFLEKCRRWFEPYTSEKEEWNEVLDMAIKALQNDVNDYSNDLISRQWLLDLYGDYIDGDVKPELMLVPLEVVRQNIKDAPSAEPVNKDAISREGLLKSWDELSIRGRTEFDQVIMTIPALPSAEPEIIRCKDCKWCVEDYYTDGNIPYWICKNWDGGTDADGFCYEAERRTDG